MNYLKTDAIEVTPELAKEWIENNLYSRQRPLRKDHVRFIAEQMRKGQFAAGTQLYFAGLKNRLHLIDGQHRLNAIVMSEISIPFVVTINHVNTEGEVAWLYTAFDRQLTRSPSAAVWAVQPAGVEGWKKWQIDVFVGALNLVCQGFTGRTKVGIPEILFGLDDWAPYAKEYLNLIEGADKDIGKKLRRKPSLAVGMSTLRFAKGISPNAPDDFWCQVAEDDGLSANDPRKHLHKRLLTLDIPSPGSATIVRVDDTSIIKLCTAAWNSYANNRVMGKLVVSRTRKYPILYTPFDNSKSTKEYQKMYDDGYKDYNMPPPETDV